MTRYIRKLKITSTSGTVHEVYAVATSHSPRNGRALRTMGWERTTERAFRHAIRVPVPVAVGLTGNLREYVARRAGIIVQRAESPAWMQEVS